MFCIVVEIILFPILTKYAVINFKILNLICVIPCVKLQYTKPTNTLSKYEFIIY
jgi:hypothetical protein